MAYEIAERNAGIPLLLLAGIKENGTVIARKLKAMLAHIFTGEVEVLEVELNKRHPGEVKVSGEFDFTGKTIILVDDVANSGKTMLYALKPFLDYHPAKIQTLALVERSHKAFPIQPDYVGLSLATTVQEHIYVDVEGAEGAWME